MVGALAALGHRRRLKPACSRQLRENSRERCAASESWIQMTLAGGIEWVSARNGASVVTVTRIITRFVAMEPDRHHPLRLALSYWFRQSATLLWTLHSGADLQVLNPQRGSCGPKMLGTTSQGADARPLPERLGGAFH